MKVYALVESCELYPTNMQSLDRGLSLSVTLAFGICTIAIHPHTLRFDMSGILPYRSSKGVFHLGLVLQGVLFNERNKPLIQRLPKGVLLCWKILVNT
jgi:hypothetical protein